MKKTITLLSIIVSTALSIDFAQPLITALNFTNLGTKLMGYTITGTINHQNAGANLTWNYGSLTHDPASFYLVDVPSSSQSQTVLDAFPTATYFTETNAINNTNMVTTVSEVNANGQFTLGYVLSGNPNVLPTPDPFLGLPLSYQSTFGNRSYDAYGTLTTPFGTYSNVVRIAHAGTTKTNYLFYSFDPLITILMTYDVDNSTQAITGAYFFDMEASSGLTEKKSNKIEIFPNPSSKTIQVKWDENINLELKVTNVLGEEIYHQVFDKDTQLSIENPGVYFVSIQNGKNLITEKVVIE